MRKKLVTGLVILAIGIWLWNARLLLVAFLPEADDTGSGSTERGKAAGRAVPAIVVFEKQGKSPLAAYEKKAQPKPVRKKPAVRKPAVKKPDPAPPPDITITGIMWNDANPLAMVKLSDGTSTVVKKGQDLPGGITVVRIERTRVQFQHESNTFWVEK
ncbi:MAG: hypothetical protein GF418_01265 [Chitinivibrionales bacterium]|nr:hypothetical protein [Chitinivibrionales bacterium]MBD3394231.1 hypothetical protein [Chitinivibrionales bacterium]